MTLILQNDELSLGVEALSKERSNWLERPDLLVRAARHYEGAAQILIRQAVMTAKKVVVNTLKKTFDKLNFIFLNH